MTERDAASVLDALGDEYARAIVAALSERPMSAKELTETLDMSQPTISRRLSTLEATDLVAESTHVDPDGHHYSVYRATLERATITIEDGAFEVRLTGQESPSDRMSYIWKEMRGP